MRFFWAKVVHPVDVGRDEHLRRRPLFNLLGECRAGGVGDNSLLPRFFLPLGVDRIERVLQTGSGEHDKISALSPDGACGGPQASRAATTRPSALPSQLRFETSMSVLPMFARALRCDGYKRKQSLYSTKYDGYGATKPSDGGGLMYYRRQS